MRALSREHLNSRSEFIRRCGWVVISTTSLTLLAACGGGGGGGSDPPPPPPPPANVAPTVQAGADQTIEWPVATAQLTGTASDSSTQTLTYTWSAASGPAGVTFGTASAAATSVTFPSEGSYTLRLSVSDGSLSTTDDVLVTVSPAVYPASDTANSDPTNHGWTRVTAATEVGMTDAPLVAAATYAQSGLGANSAGMIVRRGRIVQSWGNIDQRFELKSTSKSIGGMALGIALETNPNLLSETAVSRLSTFPAPATTGDPAWPGQITILQLATHTSGFLKEDVYTPGVGTTYAALQFAPGTTWYYSDAGLNWLSEVLTQIFATDLATVLNTEVWTPLGLNSAAGGPDGTAASNIDVKWRDNRYRINPTPGSGIEKRELASGIYANPNAMARIGLLFLRKGLWGSERVLAETFVNTVKTPHPSVASATVDASIAADFPNATTNYGVLWWTNATGMLANVPRDAFWAWGLGDSLIVVIPSLDIVAVRAGPQAAPGSSVGARVWNDDNWNGDYAVLAPFLDPIVQSVTP